MKQNEKYILIIEDDVNLCNSIFHALHNEGYAPTGVTEVREAMFKLKNQQYSCILLDMRLGSSNGEELIGFIRKRKDSQNITTPIIVISGHLDRPLLGKIIKEIQGALVKPFDVSALLEIVKKYTD